MNEVFNKLFEIADSLPCGSHPMLCDTEDIRAAVSLHEEAEDLIAQRDAEIAAASDREYALKHRYDLALAEITVLRRIVRTYGNRLAMANAPADLQIVIDEAMKGGA